MSILNCNLNKKNVHKLELIMTSGKVKIEKTALLHIISQFMTPIININHIIYLFMLKCINMTPVYSRMCRYW